MKDDIVKKIYFLLKEHNFKLATAESCTGGMIASMLTNLPGISTVYAGGYITYSNELKEQLLGIKSSTLEEFGTVSQECAAEMVNGLCKKLNVDAGIATTGIAGPDGGTKKKPVGLVYIAIRIKQKVKVKKYIFSDDRNIVRGQATHQALNMLCKELESHLYAKS